MDRHNQNTPQDPARDGAQGGHERGAGPGRPIRRRADNGELVAYSAEEYGVRKDDGLGVIKPVNSANGILFLAILLTIGMGGLVYFVVQIIRQDAWHIAGEVWWVFPACIFPFAAAWFNYFKERKAEKLRKDRNLPRPVE
ncbi:hypothetical protein [Arthrobacter sp. C9C5]|uniref:hypothetical protein n=1 Tax=Arthrobacter sp. C9C5 TaxID=2735267 RepID=UPI001585B344|nr:hypothetical protein [Arthrobacter sp. C9C5]NUU30305.1 hypothetical protein [Arthrobacter sp. C9C5]